MTNPDLMATIPRWKGENFDTLFAVMHIDSGIYDPKTKELLPPINPERVFYSKEDAEYYLYLLNNGNTGFSWYGVYITNSTEVDRIIARTNELYEIINRRTGN